jgi:hypothetical protein
MLQEVSELDLTDCHGNFFEKCLLIVGTNQLVSPWYTEFPLLFFV